jgi:hypothetical protein
MAMVQGAVYHAVNSIDRGHEPYLADLPPVSPGASIDAAVATAAHHVLVGIVPALAAGVRDSLDALYTTALGAIPPGQAKIDGVSAGAAAAAAMLAARANDGRYVPFSFVAGAGPGQWRPELTAFVSDPFAWVARVRPFTLTSTSQFRTRGPNSLRSGKCTKEFEEVKTLGSATSSTRTAEQTATALFYTDHATALWNRASRNLARSTGCRRWTRRGSSRSSTSRARTGSSTAGTTSGSGASGVRSRPSGSRARTGTRRRSPIPRGCRWLRRRRIPTSRRATTA